MDKATEAAILKELRELRVIVEATLYTLGDNEKVAAWLKSVENEAEFRRFISDSGLYALGVPDRGRRALQTKNLLTLEEVAARTRDEIAALPEVGPATIEKIEAAMAERELSWAGMD